jgi:hypothetical protein
MPTYHELRAWVRTKLTMEQGMASEDQVRRACGRIQAAFLFYAGVPLRGLDWDQVEALLVEVALDWAEEVALLEKATSQLIDAARQQGIPHDALPALVKRRLERDFLGRDGMP